MLSPSDEAVGDAKLPFAPMPKNVAPLLGPPFSKYTPGLLDSCYIRVSRNQELQQTTWYECIRWIEVRSDDYAIDSNRVTLKMNAWFSAI